MLEIFYQIILKEPIAFLSIIITVAVAFYEKQHSKKINDTNLMSEYYNSAFKNYVLDLIPQAMDKVKFIDGHVIQCNEITKVLGKLKKSSIFFKYYKTGLYDDMCGIIDTTETIIANACNEIHEKKEFDLFINKLNIQIRAIYELIFTNYKE